MRLLSQMMHLRCPSVEIEIFNSMEHVPYLLCRALVMVQLQTLHLNE